MRKLLLVCVVFFISHVAAMAGTVSDPLTGLMWQEPVTSSTYTWEEALEYCESLTLGGYSDWRLPDIVELQTLIDHSQYYPALRSLFTLPPDDPEGYRPFWSSTTYINSPAYAWTVRFFNGMVDKHIDSASYVRAVRGGDRIRSYEDFSGIKVTINPQAACDAGAQWSINNGVDWRDSGTSSDSTTPGIYTVVFKPISNYHTPDSQTVTLTLGDCEKVEALYVEEPPKVTLTGMVSETGRQNNVMDPLSGVTVQIEGGESRVTDSEGKFLFQDLFPATITVTAEKTGYYSASKIVVLEPEERNVILYLTAKSEDDMPDAFNFDSLPQGKHYIENMPGELTFGATIAWNGSPGTVRYRVNDQWIGATTTDLGNGQARAQLTVPAPTAISFCTELTIEVVNGAGKKRCCNMGVKFVPVLGFIPWYKDNILWTPSGAGISVSDDWPYSPDGIFLSNGIEFNTSFTLHKGIKYDFLAAQATGALGGDFGMGFAAPVGSNNVKILGGLGAGLEGSLTMNLQGCGAPTVVPSWSFSGEGKAGVEVPVALAVNLLAPPAGDVLANVPVIKDVKLQLYIKAKGTLTGVYEKDKKGTCWLGTTGLDGSLGGGPEATLSVENKWLGASASATIGGEGMLNWKVCPEFAFKGYTGAMYMSYAYESKLFRGANTIKGEINWDTSKQAATTAITDLKTTAPDMTWQPIGKEPLKWGDVNRLATDSVVYRKALDGYEKTEASSDEERVVENVIATASPSIFANDSGTMVLYAHYDAEKPWYAATDIATVYREEAAPWVMDQISDDQAAEFTPEVTEMGANFLLAAWTRVNGDVSGAENPEDFDPHLEIVYSWYNRISGEWGFVPQLTANSRVDRNPLPIYGGGKQGIVWIQNQGAAAIGNTASGDSLMYMEWTGSEWIGPSVLWSGPKGVLEFTFATDDQNRNHVVFSVDEDGDPETKDDRELYRVSTESGIWQPAVTLTDDDREDASPVLTAPGNLPMLVWDSAGTLKYTFLSAWNPKDVYQAGEMLGTAPTLDGVTMPGGAAIAWGAQSPDGQDIVVAFYDASLDQWSLPRRLTHDEDTESFLSLAFANHELVIAYLKTQILREPIETEINGQIYVFEDVPQTGRTDLCVLRHALGYDPAVDPDAVVLTPANPAPGSLVNVAVTVENRGDLPLESLPVDLYDGDPGSGGIFINEAILAGPLAGGHAAEITISCELGGGDMPHHLFVVLDPDMTIDDRNRSNNTASVRSTMPDLTIETAWSDPVSPTTLALTARVVNTGAIPSGDVVMSWRLDDAEGQEIGRTTVESIDPGAIYEVMFLWEVEAPIQPDQFLVVWVGVDPDNTVSELDETNNRIFQSVRTPMFTDQVGSLTVTILPPEAVAAGVQWCIDNNGDWHESESTLTLVAGTYSIYFSETAGWTLPPIDQVVVETEQSTIIEGPEILSGDINGNGTVDLSDAIVVLQVMIDSDQAVFTLNADVNDDGRIGIEEAIYILGKVAGLTH